MKIAIGIIIGAVIAFVLYKRYTTANSTTSTIPNTPQAFFAAVAAGQITFKLTDPLGIYNATGTKIGYYTADGSVYDMSNNLIAKGMGGISNTNKISL